MVLAGEFAKTRRDQRQNQKTDARPEMVAIVGAEVAAEVEA